MKYITRIFFLAIFSLIIYVAVHAFMINFSTGFIFLSIPILIGAFYTTMLAREPASSQPEWFRRIDNSKIGTFILLAAAIIVLLNIIFQPAPDSFWH